MALPVAAHAPTVDASAASKRKQLKAFPRLNGNLMSLLISCEVGGNKVPEQLIDPTLREVLPVHDQLNAGSNFATSRDGVALQHHHTGASLGKRGFVKQSRKKMRPGKLPATTARQDNTVGVGDG